jgi:hypothetical protein
MGGYLGGSSNGNSTGSNIGNVYGSAGGAGAFRSGGGGGGAGAIGSGNTGGIGFQSNILGPNYYWAAGGGGGASQTGLVGGGGVGGGGGGVGSNGGADGGGTALNLPGTSGSGVGGKGATNTGGGGGGGSDGFAGGSGGSGIVVIRYAKSVNVNSINLSTFNAIIAGYTNYVLTTRPSPLVSVTIPPGETWLTIPFDIVNNDRVKINLKFVLTGAFNFDEIYLKYKTVGIPYEINQPNSTSIAHTTPAENSGWTYYVNGRITVHPAPDITSVFTINIYRAYSNISSCYIISGNGVYAIPNAGIARVEFSGQINERIPDAIFLTWGTVYGMNAQYTITNTPG